MQQLVAAQLQAQLEAKDKEARELINSAKVKGVFPLKGSQAVAFNRETGQLPLKLDKISTSLVESGLVKTRIGRTRQQASLPFSGKPHV